MQVQKGFKVVNIDNKIQIVEGVIEKNTKVIFESEFKTVI